MGLKESMAEIFIKWTFSLLKDQSQFVKEMKKLNLKRDAQ